MSNHYDTFSMFGIDFQTKTLQSALTDAKFFDNVYEVLKSEYFGSEPHKVIWNEIKKYYEKYQCLPTFDAVKVEIAYYPDDDLKELILKALFDIEHKVNVKELEQTKDKVFEFCKNKSMEHAILRSVDLLKTGDDSRFEKIFKTVEDALKIGTSIDLGHDYFEGLNIRTQINIRKAVPTGFKQLDDIDCLDGGFAGGELAIILAPTGGGKSFWLINLGYGALKAGIDVVHYSFELSERNIGNRYDARITGIPIKKIRERAEEAEEKLSQFKGGKLIIKEYPTKSATVNTLRFHLGRLLSSGFKPGLVIVDYADLMLSKRGYEQKRFEVEAIYEDLRRMSGELQLPILSASQSNRMGNNEEIITLDRIGESYAKAQVADFVMSFSRSLKDKLTNHGKLYIAKNRIGKDGQIYNVFIDTATSFIDITNEINEQGQDQSSSEYLDPQQTVRAKLGKLYDDFKADRGD